MSSPRPLRFAIVDAFTSRPYEGNGAAVCFLNPADEDGPNGGNDGDPNGSSAGNGGIPNRTDGNEKVFTKRSPVSPPGSPTSRPPYPLTNAEMLSIAAELRLSETSFVYGPFWNNGGIGMMNQTMNDANANANGTTNGTVNTGGSNTPDSGGPTFYIRWFSPTKEIDLCGHATLASSFALVNYGNNAAFGGGGSSNNAGNGQPLSSSVGSGGASSGGSWASSASGSNTMGSIAAELGRAAFFGPGKTINFVAWKTGVPLPVGIRSASTFAMRFPCYVPEKWKRSDAKFKAVERMLALSAEDLPPLDDLDTPPIEEIYFSFDTRKLFVILNPAIDLKNLPINTETMEGWVRFVEEDEALRPLIRGIALGKKQTEYDDAGHIINATSPVGYKSPDSITQIRKRGEVETVFEARYFSPWNGVGEDPINGSSHTSWSVIWSAKTRIDEGRRMMNLTKKKDFMQDELESEFSFPTVANDEELKELTGIRMKSLSRSSRGGEMEIEVVCEQENVVVTPRGNRNGGGNAEAGANVIGAAREAGNVKTKFLTEMTGSASLVVEGVICVPARPLE